MDQTGRGFITSGRSFKKCRSLADESCTVETIYIEASTFVVTGWKFPLVGTKLRAALHFRIWLWSKVQEVILRGCEILSGAVHVSLVAGFMTGS